MYFCSILIINLSISSISITPSFISNGSDDNILESISDIILALNLLKLLDMLIKVANMSFSACSNDISKKSLSIIGILYFW